MIKQYSFALVRATFSMFGLDATQIIDFSSSPPNTTITIFASFPWNVCIVPINFTKFSSAKVLSSFEGDPLNSFLI
jgi:hypothetical protein